MQLQYREEFVSITKLKNGRINLRITKKTYGGREIPIYFVKDSKTLKDIQVRLLFNLFETSITC